MSTLKTTNIAHPSSASNNIVLDSSARVLVGTSTARSNVQYAGFSYTPAFQVQGTDQTSSFASITRTDGFFPILFFNSGSSGSNPPSGRTIGSLSFTGFDGTNYIHAASIEAAVDGTPGANDMPGRIVLSTTADGASSPAERLRIDRDGRITSSYLYNNTSATGRTVLVQSSGELVASTSSIKYKTDVEVLQDSYADAVLQIRPVWYRSLCSADNPSWGWWGFIAEEVAAIDPRLVQWKTSEVTHDEKGTAVVAELDTPEPEGVYYERFVPHLLNLIKRQGEAIADLQAEVVALKAQLA